jgi:N-carbamoyl-L-amino-acid hydrolase
MEQEWVVEKIEQLALFGKTNSGISRLAFSQADREARDYIVRLMQDSGLQVHIDEVGNIIGHMAGKDDEAAVVLTGSHIDTVPEGGKYDGVVGVIGAVAAVKRLQKDVPLNHPIEVVVFVSEESSRFGYSCIGSKSMAGMADVQQWRKTKDANGVTMDEAFKQMDLDIKTIGRASRAKEKIKAYIELHIEQGRILEQEELGIGVVEAIAAPTRLKITVEGMAAHSGGTPMDERRDALVSAAKIILAIQEIGLEQAEYGTVTTVGKINVLPGAINVIPGLAEMWVDVRGVDHESIITTLQDIKDAVVSIADSQETPVSIDVLASDKPVHMHNAMIETIEAACKKVGVSYNCMNSGAGHDAMYMARIAPAGMIFIPCKDGVSHNCEEYTTPEQIMKGIDVLTETLRQLAE